MVPFLITYSVSAFVTALLLPPVLRAFRRRGWLLENYRGRLVAFPGGLLFLPALASAWLVARVVSPLLEARAVALPAAPSGLVALGGSLVVLVGFLDDRAAGEARGWRGHLGALLSGRFTSGLLKIAGVGLVSLGAAAWRFPGDPGYLLAGALLCALAANSLNSLDLRPGRALKSYLLLALLLVAAGGREAARLSGPVLGAALVLLWADLHEETALGDAGSNLLGWQLGVVTLYTLPPAWLPGLVLFLGLFQGLAEIFSLSELIEKSRPLRAFDSWGRLFEAGTALPRANIPIGDRTRAGRKRG